MLECLPKLSLKEQNRIIRKHSSIIKLASKNAKRKLKFLYLDATKKISKI